jgi:UrcA family protein
MKITMRSTLTRRFTAPKLAILGLMLAGGAAVAQPIEEITVVAPHELQRKTVGKSTIGAPIEEVTLTHRVDYSDLNLLKAEDVATLRARITDAAKKGCDELDNLYPFDKSPEENRKCVAAANAQAQDMLTAAIQSTKPK